MSTEIKKEIQLEIAYVLFMDIVGYSTYPINEQRALRDGLNQLVQSTERFREADAAGTLIKSPAGDGMALVFHRSPEEPVECALEISRALKGHPNLPLRMGVHSGPVSAVVDVNNQTAVAGPGINLAQRVMDCGDAGHILLSEHVAEDLEQYPHWQPYLHELGECEVKHGMRVGVVNVYADEVGNSQPPKKFQALKKHRARVRWAEVAVALLVLAAIIGAFVFLLLRPTRSALAVPEKSIAVLPFQNLSKDEANAFFADGVQDEILTDLARIADLKVISRTSVMDYKSGVARNLRKIGQQLEVANVLEGSVQRSGNRVRVNVQLIETRNDRHLWGQSYDRDLADVFAIQSEIAKTIAEELHAKLSPNEKSEIERPATKDITAFDLYTRANQLFSKPSFNVGSKPNLLQAVGLLNESVARDPSFFRGFCQLAFVHDALYFFGHDRTSARLSLAEAALEAASRLRPDAGETHVARAWNLYWGHLDYDGALAELEVARRTLPADPQILFLTGLVQRRQGHWEESTRSFERAANFDPRNFGVLQNIEGNYATLGRYAEQKVWLDRILALEPDDVVTKVILAEVDFQSRADTRPLHQMIDSVRATNPGAVPDIIHWWLHCALAERNAAAATDALIAAREDPINLGDDVFCNRPFMEGVIARMAKDDDKARLAFTAARGEQEKIVQAQPNFGPAWCVLGLIDAALGRKEEALREGRHAVELLPVEKDAIRGPALIKYLAMIAAWSGDKALACQQLRIVVPPPAPVTYGQLKLMPFWDPLRGDPCFEQIVASLAPKR
jgi:TolB-like protein/class 3 adenylate cyclase